MKYCQMAGFWFVGMFVFSRLQVVSDDPLVSIGPFIDLERR